MLPGDDRAHARRGDPQTSHEAADSVTPDLRQLQARVANFARSAGPWGFTDLELSDGLKDAGSTMRTRRAELSARNIIIDSGRKRRSGDSSRRRIVWVHRDHVENPPPVIDAPSSPGAPSLDRAEAERTAANLLTFGPWLRSQGRAAMADEMDKAARLIRRLIA